LTAVGAGFCVDALFGQAQALDGMAAYQVLFHDGRGVRGLQVAVPDGIGVNDDRRPMFALVEAAGFVDADFDAEAGGFGELLQLCEELAFSVGSAGRAGRIGGTGVLADKDVTFKCGQAVFLLGAKEGRGDSRLTGGGNFHE
jgi:hypothetical protein